jgi:hypothetical protein
MEGQRGTTTPPWVWVVVSALIWFFVGQLAWLLAFGAVFVAGSRVFLAAGVALSVLAWLVAWVVSRNGAPAATWLTTALGSVPLAGTLAILLRERLPDAAFKTVPGAYQRGLRLFLVYLASVGFVAIAPPLVAWLTSVAVRRRAQLTEGVQESAVGI